MENLARKAENLAGERKEIKPISQWLLVPILLILVVIVVLLPGLAWYVGASALPLLFALVLTPNRNITEQGLFCWIVAICLITMLLNEWGHGGFDAVRFRNDLAVSFAVSYPIVRVLQGHFIKIKRHRS